MSIVKIKLFIYNNVPLFKVVSQTVNYLHPIQFRFWFRYFVLRKNRDVYWPTSPSSTIVGPKNMTLGVDSAPGYSPGCYIQCIGKVYVGDYTGLAPNVGIISSNHSLLDYNVHKKGFVHIGSYCWIGMGSIILPNVKLGDRTIVAAGSVVTDSFPDGYCVIGGNPAVLIKQFPKASYHLFNNHVQEHEYIGFMKKEKYEEYKKKFLNE